MVPKQMGARGTPVGSRWVSGRSSCARLGRCFARDAHLGHTQGGHVHEFLEANLAATLAADAALLHAAEGRAWAAARVGVDAPDARLDLRRDLLASVEVVGPDGATQAEVGVVGALQGIV